MYRLIAILSIPLFFLYGKGMIFLFQDASMSDPNEMAFWISCVSSFILSSIFIEGQSYLAIFEHELTHNLFAVLTFNRPRGFYVRRGGGGYFEYDGRSNFLIILSPYFFPTISFILLPLFMVLKSEFYLIFFIFLGITVGFHISTTLKETRLYQPDIRAYGRFYSMVIILFFNILFYGLIFSFVINGWQGMKEFLYSGLMYSYELVSRLWN